ncbi:MAG: hypothetical protein QOG88_95 [Actinomycetota bacterium]|jgi:hypothetical protein|nr:hypothetical protein [Actinomycetota bacterium]
MSSTVPHAGPRIKRTRETSGSPRTEVLSHRQPLGPLVPQATAAFCSSPSGSWRVSPCGAPSTLPPTVSPCGGLSSASHPAFALRRASGGKLPGTSAPGGSGSLDPWPRGARCPELGPLPALRPSLVPGTVLRPCGLPPSPAPSPSCDFFDAPSGSLHLTLTAWSEAKCIGDGSGGQPVISAGRCLYVQVRSARQRLTKRCCCHSACIGAGQRRGDANIRLSRARPRVRDTRSGVRRPSHPR